MMCARAGSRGFPISNAADSKSISSQLQLAYRSDSRLDFAIIRLHYSLSVRVLVWLTIVIRVDNREVSGNWYSVSDDLLEQPEIKPEFLLLLVVVVLIVRSSDSRSPNFTDFSAEYLPVEYQSSSIRRQLSTSSIQRYL